MRRGERWVTGGGSIVRVFSSPWGGERGRERGQEAPLDNAPMLPGWDYLQVRYGGPDSVHRCNNTPGILNGIA